jgi:hypothetical protein
MKAMSRRDRIVFLLDHWEDFFEQASSGGLVIVDDQTRRMSDDWTLLSSMSRHPSVVELGRCLELCRRMAKGHYNHLRAFYGSEWRTIDRPVKKRNAHGKLVDDTARVRERVVPAWVVMRMVERATDFVAGSFRGEPEIPVAWDRKLRPLADSDGWTEAA